MPSDMRPLGAGLSAPLAVLLLASLADGFGGLSYLRKPTADQNPGLRDQLETEYAGTKDSVFNMPVRPPAVASATRAHRAGFPYPTFPCTTLQRYVCSARRRQGGGERRL